MYAYQLHVINSINKNFRTSQASLLARTYSTSTHTINRCVCTVQRRLIARFVITLCIRKPRATALAGWLKLLNLTSKQTNHWMGETSKEYITKEHSHTCMRFQINICGHTFDFYGFCIFERIERRTWTISAVFIFSLLFLRFLALVTEFANE